LIFWWVVHPYLNDLNGDTYRLGARLCGNGSPTTHDALTLKPPLSPNAWFRAAIVPGIKADVPVLGPHEPVPTVL